MALEIDAFAVLRAIAAHHATFSNIRAETSRAQGTFTQKLRTLVIKQIKASASDIAALKEIRKSLGTETFDLVVDGMKDAEIKSVIGKVDKHHPEQKTASADWRRKHLSALVTGSTQPAAKAASGKVTKTSKGHSKPEKPKKALDFLFDESAGAVRKPRN